MLLGLKIEKKRQNEAKFMKLAQNKEITEKAAMVQLLEFERKNNPFQWKIDNIPIWWFVRFRIFMGMLYNDKERKEAYKRTPALVSLFKKLKNYIKRGLSILYPLICSIKKLRESQYLFLSSTNRRRSKKNGKYYNIFLDPVIDELGKNESQILERNDKYLFEKELHHVYSENLVILDKAINRLDILAQLDIIKKIYYSKKVREILDRVDLSTLGLSSGQIERILVRSLTLIKKADLFCNSIINLVKPRILFVDCGYCFWNLIFQFYAKRKSVKIIELQHGIIHENHVGYIFPKVALGSIDISPFPDHLFLFGEKYKEILEESSVINDRLVVFGYPYMREEVNKKIDKDKIYFLLNINKDKKIVLITSTSQLITQDHISDFLDKLSHIISRNYHLVLKIHPGERSNYKDKYSKLIERSNITIISQDQPKLYDLLKISYVHSSVSSTVLQEAIAFSVPNIVLKYPGYENVKELIEMNAAFLVQTPEEFIRYLDRVKDFQYNTELKNYFFDVNPKNIKHSLSNITSL